jgi:hypothetical protein
LILGIEIWITGFADAYPDGDDRLGGDSPSVALILYDRLLYDRLLYDRPGLA